MYAKSSFGLKLKKRVVGMIYYPNTIGKESKDIYQLIKKRVKDDKNWTKIENISTAINLCMICSASESSGISPRFELIKSLVSI